MLKRIQNQKVDLKKLTLNIVRALPREIRHRRLAVQLVLNFQNGKVRASQGLQFLVAVGRGGQHAPTFTYL